MKTKIKLTGMAGLLFAASSLFIGCKRQANLQDFYETHRGDNLYDLDMISADWRRDQGACYMMTTNLNAAGETYIFLGKQVKVFRIR